MSECCVGFYNGFSSSTIFSGGSRGGPPSFFDETEAGRAQKVFFETAPPLSQGPDDRPPLLSESLDPQLILEFATKGINRKSIKFFGLRAVTVTPKLNFIRG